MKRFFAFLLGVVIFFLNTISTYACDESQSDSHVMEILFGNDALMYSSDDNTMMLLDALYLCCEQADNQGQNKLDYLKKRKVNKVPTIDGINIKNNELIKSSHICWEKEYLVNIDVRANRKKILQNTVNKVFDFGTFNNLFGSESGKCNSFAALLYYSHILSDYLADDPIDTEINIKGKQIPSFVGQAYVDINGGRPSFTTAQKKLVEPYVSYSSLDSFGRSGEAFAVLSNETMPPAGSRQNIGYIKPSGWNQGKYFGIVNSEPPFLYNRCHLIAHQLLGYDKRDNLITGTRYMNEVGMKPFEDRVAKYIKESGNHVLYRCTPIYKGDNLLASGVQLEAYSVEDNGKLSFNVYCYNVQPGVNINYTNGKNESGDVIYGSSVALPFAINKPEDDKTDLIYEMNKHLEVLFGDKKSVNAANYSAMISEIESIAYEARSIGKIGEKSAQSYMKMKQCEYKYYQVLTLYVPMLLKSEDFFRSAYK